MTGRNIAAKRAALFYLAAVACAGFATALPFFWHEKVYVDGARLVAARPEWTTTSGSFESAAWLLQPLLGLLRATGVDLSRYGQVVDLDLFTANLVFGLIALAVVFLVTVTILEFPNARVYLGYAVVLVSVAPFFFRISKEVIPLTLSGAILLWWRTTRKSESWLVVALGVAFVGLGLFFRLYYVAFGVLLVSSFFMAKQARTLVAFYLAAFGVLFLSFPFLPHEMISIGRSAYLEGASASRIDYPFADSGPTEFTLNRLVTFVRLLLPLELGARSLAYAPFILVQILITIGLLSAISRRDRTLITVAAYVVLAHTFIGALYEPDFGSYFRHKVGVLAFMLLLVPGVRHSLRASEEARRLQRPDPQGVKT